MTANFSDDPTYAPSIFFENVPPGSYYFHLRSIDNAGNWGNISGDPGNCTAHIGPLIVK